MQNLIDHLENGELPSNIFTAPGKKALKDFVEFMLSNDSLKKYFDELTYVNDKGFYTGGRGIVETQLAICPCCVSKLFDDGFQDYYYNMCSRALLERADPVEAIISAMADTFYTVKASQFAVNLQTVH